MLGYISVAVSFLFLQFSWLSLYLSLGFWLSSQFCGFWESSWNLSIRYMLGKESETLARVLATVVKFTPDELREVIRHEEKKHSLLSSLGILPH